MSHPKDTVAGEFEAFDERVPLPKPSHHDIMQGIGKLSEGQTQIMGTQKLYCEQIRALQSTAEKLTTAVNSLVAWKNSIKAVSAQ